MVAQFHDGGVAASGRARLTGEPRAHDALMRLVKTWEMVAVAGTISHRGSATVDAGESDGARGVEGLQARRPLSASLTRINVGNVEWASSSSRA